MGSHPVNIPFTTGALFLGIVAGASANMVVGILFRNRIDRQLAVFPGLLCR